MYNDACLPQDEAWQAMARTVLETKASRNAVAKENVYVIPYLSRSLMNVTVPAVN